MRSAPTWVRAAIGAAASAALLGFAARAEAPFHWLSFLAFAPWLISIDRAPARATLGSAALLAVLFTAAAFGWLPGTISAYSGASGPIAWAVTLVLAPLVLQPQIVAASAARVWARQMTAQGRYPRLTAGATFALGYVGAEWLLPKLFSDTLGYAFHPSAVLRQAADLAGGRGLTLACLAVSECAATAVLETIRRDPSRTAWARLSRASIAPALGAAAVIAALVAYGAGRLRQIEARTAAASRFTAGVVQANIARYDKLAAERGTFDAVKQILDAHLSLSKELLEAGSAGPALDLLVWPETVYPTTFGSPKSPEGAAFDAQIAALVAATGVPLIFGAFEQGEHGEHNAAFFLSKGDRGVGFDAYRKSRLFPLTESVPEWLDGPLFRSWFPWAGHWQAGPGAQAISLTLQNGSAVSFAPLICYEAVYPAYVGEAARAGAQVLLAISNDTWFPDARGPRLHLISAAFRSIETRLPQIRATNSGISALILPSGEIVNPTGFNARATLRLSVPRLGASGTLATLWGDWLGGVSLGLAALVLAFAKALQMGRERVRSTVGRPQSGRSSRR